MTTHATHFSNQLPVISTKLLVVEDDPTVRMFVYDALLDEGYDVQTAVDGQAALDCLAAMRPASPDAILLDMNMPRMNGWRFAAAYRLSAVPPPHAPLIVMTADTDAARSCREVDGAAYLSKPFTLNDLYAVVEQHTAAAA